MYNKKKILAIIPARGGSKGLPGKNIKPLNGKPLINWAIDALRDTGIVDRIFVSTDSVEIANIAKQNGTEIPFLRNKYLAKDNSLVIDAVFEAISYFEKQGEIYDIVLLIEPTSPLRTSQLIYDCVEQLINSSNGSIATFSELEVPLERVWKLEEGKISMLGECNMGFRPRQTLTKVYKLNGLLYGIKKDILLVMEYPQVITEDVISYITPRKMSTDIDDIDDFEYIQFLLIKDGK